MRYSSHLLFWFVKFCQSAGWRVVSASMLKHLVSEVGEGGRSTA